MALIVLKIPGGVLDGRAYVVHGMPKFKPGEELVVFCTPPHQRTGVCVPTGLAQGLYSVDRSSATGPKVKRDTRHLNLVELKHKKARSVPGKTESLSLDDLLRQIRSEVALQHAKGKAEAEKSKKDPK